MKFFLSFILINIYFIIKILSELKARTNAVAPIIFSTALLLTFLYYILHIHQIIILFTIEVNVKNKIFTRDTEMQENVLLMEK